ncbi:MAG: hypothetical protein KC421_12465 [Anaerolineales bacterium]|nr:hypothetical protein [Anaerolineales bacterium]
MKPLVYYTRWQGATLRLRGRDETAVWGHLVFTNADGSEQEKEFRFQLQNQEMTLFEEGEPQVFQLDEMGVVVQESS